MELVDRYIAAVKFWLPSDIEDDIAAELAEDIRSEIEEAEAEKGRKLTDDEISALLKERGAPLTVARRYLPQRSLIGPELFPVYILVLKIAGAVVVGLWLIGNIASGAMHGRWGSFNVDFNGLLMAFAVVTIIFAIIERNDVLAAKTKEFNPKTLPPVVDKNRLRRSDLIGEIAGNLVFVWLFFAGYLSRSEYWLFNMHIVLSPEWVGFCQISLALALAEIALTGFQLFRPSWNWPTILFRLLFDLAKTFVLGWFLSSHAIRLIESPGIKPHVVEKIVFYSDMLAQYAIPFCALIAFGILIAATVRFVRLRWKGF
ncbi:hypothetical protein FHS83_000176 [Rhizomicrobium palustre]|uniref:Uncharacterized protein n=1 Tax=Rhizomicrobium palustre TaxID=189966 RepID=A0A846MTN0_9PROT|nr:hypothetical protein [Rhizomicrobium palustre]NIK86858.1 hypothetical protein [Rhizomicrobium palustre]